MPIVIDDNTEINGQPGRQTSQPRRSRATGLRRVGLMALLLVAGLTQACKKGSPTAAAAVSKPVPVAEEALAATLPGKPIVLPCDWSEGDVYHYSHVRKRTDTRKPFLADLTTTTPVTVTVTQSGNPAHFAYHAGVSIFEGPEAAIAPIRSLMGDLEMPTMQLVMQDGFVTQVANLEEMVAAMEPVLRGALPPDAPPAVFEQTMAMFKDPVTGNALMLKDPGKLFALHCIALEEDEVLSTDMHFPNPFGGEPLPGHSLVRYKAHDAETLTFETEDSLDPEAFKNLLPELVKRFAPAGELDDAQLEEMMNQMPPIDNRLMGTMVYSRVDGFPISVDVTQLVGAPDHPMHRSDTWIWNRVESP